MADSKEVFEGIKKADGVSYPVLTPNMHGFETAMKAGVREVRFHQLLVSTQSVLLTCVFVVSRGGLALLGGRVRRRQREVQPAQHQLHRAGPF